jgi:diaminohydroxyphosphoribosylaminopyrimidine deaminase/5-amino-6-(5-phosphoribosylamino)uracil reductase
MVELNSYRASDTEFDIRWMSRALELGRKGIGLCSPNPQVGCVILDSKGALAGEGWHEYDKRDHAEVVAIREAGDRARGGTAYVTLEPCNHTGRTGPCSQALIATGVARVVAATADPNELVAGEGLETLRRAGIAVEVGVLEPEARRLNEGFARWIQTRRPLVLMKVAMTLDGKIAPAAGLRGGMEKKREPYWITGEASRAAVQEMRWAADAVLTGVETVIADDPMLTDRSGRARRRPLLRVVLDSALRMPLDSKLVHTARESEFGSDVVLFTVMPPAGDGHATQVALKRMEELRECGVRVEVVAAEMGRVSLPALLDKLGTEGILTVLTETGARLNTALLSGGLVDRLRIFSSPQIFGADGLPAFRDMPVPVRLNGSQVERFGEDLSVSGLLRDPWASPDSKG